MRISTKFLCLISLSVFGSSPAQMANCTISILTERNSGERIRIKFNSVLGSKQECIKLSEMHQPNFTPDLIRSKRVSYQWTGKEPQPIASKIILKYKKNSSAHLAKAEKARKSHRSKSR